MQPQKDREAPSPSAGLRATLRVKSHLSSCLMNFHERENVRDFFSFCFMNLGVIAGFSAVFFILHAIFPYPAVSDFIIGFLSVVFAGCIIGFFNHLNRRFLDAGVKRSLAFWYFIVVLMFVLIFAFGGREAVLKDPYFYWFKWITLPVAWLAFIVYTIMIFLLALLPTDYASDNVNSDHPFKQAFNPKHLPKPPKPEKSASPKTAASEKTTEEDAREDFVCHRTHPVENPSATEKHILKNPHRRHHVYDEVPVHMRISKMATEEISKSETFVNESEQAFRDRAATEHEVVESMDQKIRRQQEQERDAKIHSSTFGDKEADKHYNSPFKHISDDEIAEEIEKHQVAPSESLFKATEDLGVRFDIYRDDDEADPEKSVAKPDHPFATVTDEQIKEEMETHAVNPAEETFHQAHVHGYDFDIHTKDPEEERVKAERKAAEPKPTPDHPFPTVTDQEVAEEMSHQVESGEKLRHDVIKSGKDFDIHNNVDEYGNPLPKPEPDHPFESVTDSEIAEEMAHQVKTGEEARSQEQAQEQAQEHSEAPKVQEEPDSEKAESVETQASETAEPASEPTSEPTPEATPEPTPDVDHYGNPVTEEPASPETPAAQAEEAKPQADSEEDITELAKSVLKEDSKKD